MRRVSTYMLVRAGMEDRYREAHRNIWPEVLEGISRFGFQNYSIFMRGRELFSYFEVEDLEEATAMALADPWNQRWQQYMTPVMDVGSGMKDGSTNFLEEVFHYPGCKEASPMRRVATLMMAKEGMEERYRRAHQNVWPEVLAGIERCGIQNYSIFMRGRQIFSCFRVTDLDKAMAMAAADIANQRWQEYMTPVMDVGSGIKDSSTVYLEEIFHVD